MSVNAISLHETKFAVIIVIVSTRVLLQCHINNILNSHSIYFNTFQVHNYIIVFVFFAFFSRYISVIF